MTEDNVMKVRNLACDQLLERRVQRKARTANLDKLGDRVYIAFPKKRDNKARPPTIPAAVLAERAQKRALAEARGDGDGGGGPDAMDVDGGPTTPKARKLMKDIEA